MIFFVSLYSNFIGGTLRRGTWVETICWLWCCDAFASVISSWVYGGCDQ